MIDDEVIIISEQPEAIVLVVEEDAPTVVIVEETPVQVLVINEGPQGPPGSDADVPVWVTQTKITVSNAAPVSPSIGDVWIDTN